MDDQRTNRESGGSVKTRRWRWPRISIIEILVAVVLLIETAALSIQFPKRRAGVIVGCIALLCGWLLMRAREEK